MNYTQPDKPDHVDSPDDWLQSSLAFAAALGKILQENEGIIIDAINDLKSTTGKLLIYKSKKMVHIDEYTGTESDGQMVWLHMKEGEEL